MPEQVKKRLEEEIKQLEYELTTELPAEIKKAVALGDLSENAEYHMAKQRQVFVNARLGQLKKRMAELALVNLSNIPKDRIAFGSTIVVFDTTKNEEITYKLVTSEESDVNQGLISTTFVRSHRRAPLTLRAFGGGPQIDSAICDRVQQAIIARRRRRASADGLQSPQLSCGGRRKWHPIRRSWVLRMRWSGSS